MTQKNESEKTSIWWIRRDLRVEDNQALAAAVGAGETVVPLFIIDPQIVDSPRMGEHRLAFLWAGLRDLRRSIQERGGDLLVREGDPLQVLTDVVHSTGASRIYAEEDYTPYARKRDSAIRKQLSLALVPGLTIAHPDQISKNDGGPYQVYSYFMRKWKDRFLGGEYGDLLEGPERIPWEGDLKGDPIPEDPGLPEGIPFRPGQKGAREKLQAFRAGEPPPIHDYEEGRDRPDREGTSKLSPYLHFGMVSIRRLVSAAEDAMQQAPDQESRAGAETWLEELIWRDFYISILYHFPHVLEGNFRESYDPLIWRNDPEEFADWKQGKTGYPLVDAGMRQLLDLGWMHNRVRMVVGSFLVKDLLVDWRWGEDWFMERLIDADLAANNGGWQWVAGTGTDASPYFRIFNPVSQSEKHDPHGEYIRRYLPELEAVPDEYIHEPWKMPEDVQAESGCRIGEDYPEPLVDHGKARERTLKAYREAREKSEEGSGQ